MTSWCWERCEEAVYWPMHDAWTWRVWMSLYRPAHPTTWVQRDGLGRSVRCVAVEPGEDRPIFRKRGEGVSLWSGALCYCLVPHIPSLTDRSEGATGTSTSWGGWGGVRLRSTTQCLSTDGFWWWEWCCRSLGPGKETDGSDAATGIACDCDDAQNWDGGQEANSS